MTLALAFLGWECVVSASVLLRSQVYVTEAGSLDPMLEFARKASEASNGGWRDTSPPISRGMPHAKRKQMGQTCVFERFA